MASATGKRTASRRLNATLFLLFAVAAACRTEAPQAAYNRAWALYTSGAVREAAELAHIQSGALERSGQGVSYWKFRLLESEALLAQGKVKQASALLASPVPANLDSNQLELRRRMDIADASSKSGRVQEALSSLERIRASATDPELQTRIDVLYGALLARSVKLADAEEVLQRAEHNAARRNDAYQQTSALVNLSSCRKWAFRYSDAVDYGLQATALAEKHGYRRLSAMEHANLGSFYRILGDYDRAMQEQKKAIDALAMIGDRNSLLIAYGELGLLYRAEQRYPEAIREYERGYNLARELGRSADAARNAGNIAEAYVEQGGAADLQNAEEWNNRARELEGAESASGPYQTFNAARIAWIRGQDDRASRLSEKILNQHNVPPALLWDVHYYRALASDKRKEYGDAANEYRAAVNLIDKTRSDLLAPSQKITFLSRLIAIHQHYVDLEVRRGRDMEAIRLTEESRARVMAERVGRDAASSESLDFAGLTRIAKNANVSLISFWIAPERSYAWLITSTAIRRFNLPGSEQIEPLVTAYRDVVEHPLRDPIASHNPDGPRLWTALLKDIAANIPKGSRAIVIPDGPLHRLNLETLPVPSAPPHYWMRDVELAIAPSLAIAASQQEAQPQASPALLLIGAPDYRGTEYVPLEKATSEIRNIQMRFPGAVQAVYTGRQATPAAYRNAQPGRFSIIHFAAHAEASNENPLESAVVLSRQGDFNKLYARDVMDLPIQAKLVTVSACRSAGVRAYAGEGLIGFAWAFLQSGAHAVVAGLWDVSDTSTEPLMNEFYAGLAGGNDAVTAMHAAKAALIQKQTQFAKPYYWAGFQVYVRSAAQ